MIPRQFDDREPMIGKEGVQLGVNRGGNEGLAGRVGQAGGDEGVRVTPRLAADLHRHHLRYV